MKKMKVANQDSSNTLIYWMKRHSPALRIISVTVYYLIGITFYHITEDWTYIDSAFFVTSSVATIGYGEVHPTNDVGRLFTAFYILAGLAIVLTAVDDLARYIAVRLETSLMEYMLPGNSLLERSVKKLYISVSLLVMLACIGVLFFALNEDWTTIQAFYWTVCSMTTVGLGDLHIEQSSTRLFSTFFIAACVIVYAMTVYNVREYHRLSSQEAERVGDHLSDTTGSSVDGDGDIELNPLRHSSFDSTEDDGLGNYNNSVIDKLQRGGDSNGYKIVGYDPVDTELDVSQRSAHIISPSVGGRVQNAATYVVNGSLKARSTSFSARSYEHLKVKSRSSGSGGSEKGVLINSLEAPKFDSDECKEVVFRLESPDGTNMASDVHAGSEEAVVDATLHLLRILESLNGEGSALAADLALLRKKYDLAVPHDERVTMTRKELADLCLVHRPDVISPRSPIF